MADKRPATITNKFGSFPLNPPVIKGLEKGFDLVFFDKSKLRRIDVGKREGVLVAGLEVVIGWEEVGCVEVEICAASGAGVDRCH
ncbi:hypothetical protein HanXRQr2_Chr14g0643311 [Helianthus annuus]|uniref:Uncharacterized protein n=1 Tax=Helianthus annuus TaxID=4232 RepID=A0A9K3H7M9_HELAN|nr:hypothetical protein HanXRQr2_Chr14g0643311 [Helianthus annuus]KAJ0840313.1 hypothetical protein HanPSC8_Chr14g0617201 [Helianthus annuus]